MMHDRHDKAYISIHVVLLGILLVVSAMYYDIKDSTGATTQAECIVLHKGDTDYLINIKGE